MKNIILFLLLISGTAWAMPGNVVQFVGVPAAGGGETGLLFEWHCENTTVTSGTPSGSSAGDTTATANSDAAINNDHTAQDGSYHCDFPTTYDRYLFDVSSNDIIDPAEGTVIFYFKYQAFGQSNSLFSAYIDANNYISVLAHSSDQAGLTLVYSGQGTGNTTSCVPSGGLSANTWYKVTAKWSAAGVDESGTKYLYIDIDDSNGAYGTAALTVFSGSLGSTSFRIGDYAGADATSDFQIDNIKVYDSWL